MGLLPKNEPRAVEPDKNIKMFLYGEPYSGKTTFASKFPKPVILSSDGNYRLLTTPAITLKSTTEWLAALEELEQGKDDFETVIIDVVDQFFDVYREEFLQAKGKEHETDLNMKGWEMVRKPFKNLIYRFANIPNKNIIFIGHSKDKTLKDRFGIETNVTTYVLPDDLARYINGLVTMTLHTAVEKTTETDDNGFKVYVPKHMLYLNALDESIKGGSRILFSKDKIDLGYDEFMEVMKESITNPITSKPVDKAKVTEKKPLKPLKAPTKAAEGITKPKEGASVW